MGFLSQAIKSEHFPPPRKGHEVQFNPFLDKSDVLYLEGTPEDVHATLKCIKLSQESNES